MERNITVEICVWFAQANNESGWSKYFPLAVSSRNFRHRSWVRQCAFARIEQLCTHELFSATYRSSWLSTESRRNISMINQREVQQQVRNEFVVRVFCLKKSIAFVRSCTGLKNRLSLSASTVHFIKTRWILRATRCICFLRRHERDKHGSPGPAKAMQNSRAARWAESNERPAFPNKIVLWA